MIKTLRFLSPPLEIILNSRLLLPLLFLGFILKKLFAGVIGPLIEVPVLILLVKKQVFG